MTKKELIKALEQYPDDMEIRIETREDQIGILQAKRVQVISEVFIPQFETFATYTQTYGKERGLFNQPIILLS